MSSMKVEVGAEKYYPNEKRVTNCSAALRSKEGVIRWRDKSKTK